MSASSGACANASFRRRPRFSASWPALRAKVIERDGFRCVDCGDYADLTADFLPGGPHSQNLADYQTRCRRCHGRVHATRQGRASRRRKLGLEPPRLPDSDDVYPRPAPEPMRELEPKPARSAFEIVPRREHY